jgi:hypothetical protein
MRKDKKRRKPEKSQANHVGNGAKDVHRDRYREYRIESSTLHVDMDRRPQGRGFLGFPSQAVFGARFDAVRGKRDITGVEAKTGGVGIGVEEGVEIKIVQHIWPVQSTEI